MKTLQHITEYALLVFAFLILVTWGVPTIELFRSASAGTRAISLVMIVYVGIIYLLARKVSWRGDV